MSKDEALRTALDWFKCYQDKSMSRNNAEQLADEAITAIRQALEAPVQEPCGWQFYQDSKWHNGMETSNHRANTEAAGIPVRNVYPAAPVQPGRNHYEDGDVFERIAAMNKPAAQPEQKVVLVQMRAGRTWVTVDKPTVKEQKEKAQRLMRNYPGAYEMRELAIASHTRHVMYDSQAHDMKKLKEKNT